MNLDQLTWKKQFLSEKNAFILDVRTPEEFEISRIPNSKNIDFYNPQNFMEEIQKLDKDNSYYVYCIDICGDDNKGMYFECYATI